MKYRALIQYLIIICIILVSQGLFQTVITASAASDYQNGYIGESRYIRVYYEKEENLQRILETNLIIDRFLFNDKSITCYAQPEHTDLFGSLGLIYTDIPTTAELFRDPEYKEARSAYRTFNDVVTELNQISSDYPQFTQLLNIGSSVQGRALYFLRITGNIQSNPVKPEFHYISTMHGNEKVGTEMCMEFIYYLLENYGTDPYVTGLLDELDIYVMPIMNPDGFVSNTRNNANGYDLNRNFPDFITNPEDTQAGKQVETAALMQFYADRRGVLSANFHTGALVVNYPWDSTSAYHPENDMAIALSLRYSIFNSPMYNSSSFPNGITKGSAWYIIHGGMQDYSCYYHSNFQVTVELSDSFQPPASTLPQLWLDNKYSMLYYTGATRRGVQGYTLDALTHEPVHSTLTVEGIDWEFENDADSGLIHKMLLPGTYTIQISAEGYLTKIISGVTVGDDWDTTTFLGNIYMDVDTSSFISLNDYQIDDSSHNNDGILNPGETAGLIININNNSPSIASGLSSVISTDSPYAYIMQDYSSYPDIAPGGNADNITPYVLSVSALCPHDEIVDIRFDWTYGDYSGVVYIYTQVKDPNILEIGDGSTEITEAPIYTYYHDNRTQVIYTAEDMGNTESTVKSLAINVSALPSLPMNNWTIRMKHTSKNDYGSSAVFEATGWTVVYQDNITISQTGWHEFEFDNPFEYDGIQNLMIDFSFNNSSWQNPGGKVYWTGTPAKRTIYAYSDSNHGDPLNWPSSGNPTVHSINNIINLKLGTLSGSDPSIVVVYRFFNTVRGGHLYTISEIERDYIIENLPEWNYEGPKFDVYEAFELDSTPAYRFFNTITGIHIYTISETERDAIMELPEWNYEGVKFFVHEDQAPWTIPIYRFFNHVHGGHLFTISEYERDTVMQLPEWTYEGVPFYVFPLAI